MKNATPNPHVLNTMKQKREALLNNVTSSITSGIFPVRRIHFDGSKTLIYFTNVGIATINEFHRDKYFDSIVIKEMSKGIKFDVKARYCNFIESYDDMNYYVNEFFEIKKTQSDFTLIFIVQPKKSNLFG
jgi:hypothetical protein